MKKINYIKMLFAAVILSLVFTTNKINSNFVSAEPGAVQSASVSTGTSSAVSPLAIVNSPRLYLHKRVTMNAKFDKFSTLGLDYKPAFKSSEEYISFLIKRDDTVHNIPLSEMKLFLRRTEAEKFMDLKTNDEVRIVGTVFSDALGDAWINVEHLTVTKKAPKEDGVKK